MIQDNHATILYIEPKRIADWNEDMLENARKELQSFSGKFYEMRLINILFHSKEPLINDRFNVVKDVLKKTVKDYPELADEVKRLFPQIFA